MAIAPIVENPNEAAEKSKLECVLKDTLFAELHGKLSGPQLFETYIRLNKERIDGSFSKDGTYPPNLDLALLDLALCRYYGQTAEILLEFERMKPHLTHPTDAEPQKIGGRGITLYNFGGGEREPGGYTMEVNPNGENTLTHHSNN